MGTRPDARSQRPPAADLADRPVGIVHAAADRAVALRVVGDARGFGVRAELVPQGPPDETPAWSHLSGLVLVHGPRVWWSGPELDAAQAWRSRGGRVAVARLSSRRLAPSLHGLATLGLWDRRYKPDRRAGTPGHALIAEIFGGGHPPTGEARRGHVFVSYRGRDTRRVDRTLVPALAEHGFGFFDYRGTEELDEERLTDELRRWVDACAVLLVVSGSHWRRGTHTRMEWDHARRLGRPVVSVRARARRPWPDDLAPPAAEVSFDDGATDGAALARALRAAASGPSEPTG